MQYRYFHYSWHHYTWNSTISDAVQLLLYSWHHCKYKATGSVAVPVSYLIFGTTVSAIATAVMQYRSIPLNLASLYLQNHSLWGITGYFPYSWHHCFYNSTKSDEVPVTCLTVGTTVPSTELALMQYRLLALQFGTIVSTTALTLVQFRVLALNIAPLYLEQHHLWFSNGYLYYIWHYCACNSSSSNAVQFTTLQLASL